jgi:hypothetical protein
MTKTVSEYKDKNFIRFVKDCQGRGLKVEHTEGVSDPRPFVRCINLFDVKEVTEVKIQWLKKHTEFMVFPVKAKAKTTKFNAAL